MIQNSSQPRGLSPKGALRQNFAESNPAPATRTSAIARWFGGINAQQAPYGYDLPPHMKNGGGA